MNRTRDYYRKERVKHIRRKHSLILATLGNEGTIIPGKLSKGKIHCSCPMCSFHGYTMQDRRRADAMLFEIFDEDEGKAFEKVERLRKTSRNAWRLKGVGSSNHQRCESKPDMGMLGLYKDLQDTLDSYAAVKRVLVNDKVTIDERIAMEK